MIIYLFRLVAYLCLCVSLNSFAGHVTIHWSGHLESVVVGDTVSHPVLSKGEKYSGTVGFSENDIGVVQDNYYDGSVYTFYSGQSSLDVSHADMQLNDSIYDPTLGIIMV